MEILHILHPFKTEDLRSEVLGLAYGDPQRQYDEEEIEAATKVENIVRDLLLDDEDTLVAVEEHLDAHLGLCDCCDKKTFVRRVHDASGVEIDYCILGCEP